ncbi:MAG TPA: type IV secretion system DNA-binding domain-containing protein [Mycobacteriales bacterium]|nr:type IV secretion system DNA-binding domain-containing protein [Mycobacteriales bacterium]
MTWLTVLAPSGPTEPPELAAGRLAPLLALARSAGPVQLALVGRPRRVGLHARAAAAGPLAGLLRAGYPTADVAPGAEPFDDDPPRHAVGASWWLPAERALPDLLPRLLAGLAEVGLGESGVVSAVIEPAPAAAVRRLAAGAARLEAGLGGAEPLWSRCLTAPALALGEVLSAALSAAPAGPAARPRPRATASELAAARVAQARLAGGCAAVTLRTGWAATDPDRAAAGHATLAAVLAAGGLERTGADGAKVWAAIRSGRPERRARRRCVLGAAEIAALVRLPGADEPVAPLARAGSARRPAARPLDPAGIRLAVSHGPGAGEPVGVSVAQLMTHAYVVGPSGTGKTALLTRLVLGLAEQRVAAVVLDPHGDLIRQVLSRLPDAALGATSVLNLTATRGLPTLNPLWVDRGPDPELVERLRTRRVDAVVKVFADLWGLNPASTPNLLHFLKAALTALVATGSGCLADLPRFLTDPVFRGYVLQLADSPRATARWAEFDGFDRGEKTRTVRAILNKAAAFDSDPVLGTVFGDPGPGLRLEDCIDHGRLLLVDLPRGLVGPATGALVGSLLVTMLHLTVLAREELAPGERRPVVAVIDEFQEFSLTSFAEVVTSARKYGLGLVVANQNLATVAALNPTVLETLLANAATYCAFRLAAGDAARLFRSFPGLRPEDLAGQGSFECYWRHSGPRGPEVTSARTEPLVPPVRDHPALAGLRAALRPAAVAGPARLSLPTPAAPQDDW